MQSQLDTRSEYTFPLNCTFDKQISVIKKTEKMIQRFDLWGLNMRTIVTSEGDSWYEFIHYSWYHDTRYEFKFSYADGFGFADVYNLENCQTLALHDTPDNPVRKLHQYITNKEQMGIKTNFEAFVLEINLYLSFWESLEKVE